MAIFKSSFDDVAIRDLTITECLFESLSKRRNDIVLTDGGNRRDADRRATD